MANIWCQWRPLNTRALCSNRISPANEDICAPALPDWSKKAVDLGLRPIEGFRGKWIPPNQISNSQILACGVYGKVHLSTYHNNAVVVKSANDRSIEYRRILTEAILSAHMMRLGVGPEIIGLMQSTPENFDLPAIVSRFVPGTITLDQMIYNINSYRPKTVMKVLADVAAKLGVMHRHHYVHNDCKGDNVILIPDYRARGEYVVYLIDFGHTTSNKPVNGMSRMSTGNRLSRNRLIVSELAMSSRASKKDDVLKFGYILSLVWTISNNRTIKRMLEPLLKRCEMEHSELRPRMDQLEEKLRRHWRHL